jgi:hypothetical protein
MNGRADLSGIAPNVASFVAFAFDTRLPRPPRIAVRNPEEF